METYYISLDYERASQGIKGSTSFNLELPEDWNLDYIKSQLADDFFCCKLTIKEVRKVIQKD